VVVEEEIQQTRTVSDVQDVSVSYSSVIHHQHQLQELLQQAIGTMEKLLQQPKPSPPSQGKLFVASPSDECVIT